MHRREGRVLHAPRKPRQPGQPLRAGSSVRPPARLCSVNVAYADTLRHLRRACCQTKRAMSGGVCVRVFTSPRLARTLPSLEGLGMSVGTECGHRVSTALGWSLSSRLPRHQPLLSLHRTHAHRGALIPVPLCQTLITEALHPPSLISFIMFKATVTFPRRLHSLMHIPCFFFCLARCPDETNRVALA